MSSMLRFATFFWAGMVALSFSARAADVTHSWSQWRGPTRDSRTPAARWPAGLDSAKLEKQWSVAFSPSYSGPIVWQDRVFTTETVDEQFERAIAVDRETGAVLWSRQWEGAMKVPFFAASRGSWIRSTPACDGQRLYVGGMLDVLTALDVNTGAEVWRVDFVRTLKTPVPNFGFVSSPLIDGDAVYVQAGGGVVKLDKRTGDIIWSSLSDGGGMYGSAFSSPVVETLAGQRQLIVQTRQKLAGIDLQSGDVLWSQEVPAFRGMNILTPTVWNERIFTSSYGGKSFLYSMQHDQSGFHVDVAWENKVQAYMSSPVVIDDHAYVHLRNRRFTCIDLNTGQEKWITKPFGEYWSMIAQGDRILALDERGDLMLIAANPAEFQLLDQRKVSDDSAWGHLANDRDQLFVRELSRLTAYRWSENAAGQ